MHSIIVNTLTAYAATKNPATPRAHQGRESDHCMDMRTDISFESISPSSGEEENGEEAPPSLKRLPLKKQLVVRWKDQFDGDKYDASDTEEVGLSKYHLNIKQNVDDVGQDAATASRKSRPSTPPPLVDTSVLQKRIAKQERAIRAACKLELKLLNEAKQVRDRRSKMVERLQQMKRKARRLIVINAQMKGDILSEVPVIPSYKDKGADDQFVLPPVWVGKSKSETCSKTDVMPPSCYVDMTTEGSVIV